MATRWPCNGHFVATCCWWSANWVLAGVLAGHWQLRVGAGGVLMRRCLGPNTVLLGYWWDAGG
eukprot:11150685-Lingulodinium_polyedra.AAC.1